MNAEQCAVVQRLISNLDDSRVQYLMLKSTLVDLHARFLVSRVINLHAVAADDLVRQVRLAGGVKTHRGGGVLARLHAQAACLMAIGSTDRETACLKRIARHEDRVTQRFQAVIAQVKDLPQALHYQLIVLERARFQIELLIRETEASPAAPYSVPAAANLPEHEQSRKWTPTRHLDKRSEEYP